MRKNLSFILVIITFIICNSTNSIDAQNPYFSWAKVMTGNNTASAMPICIGSDIDSNLYICGTSGGLIDFDPSINHLFPANSNERIFILKLNRYGNLQWVKFIESANSSATSLTIGNDGMIYITGNFSGTTDFDPSVNQYFINPTGNVDAFILKMDTAGQMIWATNIGGFLYDMGCSIVADSENNIIITGFFSGNVDFDPSATSTYFLQSAQSCCFILKLNSNMEFVWAKKIPTSEGVINTVDDNNNIYIAGSFSGPIELIPSEIIQAVGGSDAYIVKFSKNGDIKWVKAIGFSENDNASAMSYDHQGNIVCSGFYGDTTGLGRTSVFIQKYDTTGTKIWEDIIKGQSDNYLINSNYLDCDQNGNIFITGRFFGNIDFNPGDDSLMISSQEQDDPYIMQITSTGNLEWARTIRGAGSGMGQSIHVFQNNQIFTVGVYAGTTDFDTDTSSFIINVNPDDSQYKMFVHKISLIQPYVEIKNITSCKTYLYNSNIYSQSGNYIESFPNNSTADSIIRLYLTINEVDTSIQVNGATLLSNAQNSTFQWVDCNNGFQIINGQISSEFSPTENGSYSVIINTNQCIDTSSCYVINNIAINEFYPEEISVVPNPTTDILNIKISDKNIAQKVELVLMNIQGEIIDKSILYEHNKSISLAKYSKGIYFLKLSTINNVFTYKIILE